jgi:hypothetical protein
VFFPVFDRVSELRLGGSAKTIDGRLVLAEGLQQAGSAWAAQPVDLSRAFGTWFRVAINRPADGLAFVIQAAGEDALGGPGAGLGYGGRPGVEQQPRIRPSLAVELDTWHNGRDGHDPDGVVQHVAVITDGDVTRHHVWADPGFDLRNNQPFFVWVSYGGPLTRMLTVRISQTSDEPRTALLTYEMDLRALLNTDRAWIGFTGGTGLADPGGARVEVLSWSIVQS